jgi:hypothetical protein
MAKRKCCTVRCPQRSFRICLIRWGQRTLQRFAALTDAQQRLAFQRPAISGDFAMPDFLLVNLRSSD